MVTDDQNHHTEAVLAKAGEILARELTPEELAEQEARAKTNRIERIMSRERPAKEADDNRDDAPATRAWVRQQLSTFMEALVPAIRTGKLFHIGINARVAALEARTASKPRYRVKAETRRL